MQYHGGCYRAEGSDMNKTMDAYVKPLIPALRRYARGLVRDRDAADDVVQDCLEKVVANWHSRRDDDPRSWIFAILHNVAINRLRQASRRGKSIHLVGTSIGIASANSPQESALFGKQVLSAIYELAPEHRSLLLLVGVEAMTYAQAAKVMGIPAGTVMSRLSRAREQLRILVDELPSTPARSSEPTPS